MKFPKREGFTLVELLIVISIISILLSFSVVFFKDYKKRAYLTQDGMLLAKNCIGNLISYCINHPNQIVNPLQDPNCKSTASVFGNITFFVKASTAVCTSDGQLPDRYTIIVRSSVVDNYHIECTYYQTWKTYRCLIKQDQ
jgi:prepilin-type N-terminal cleavage/methylation domain-containing protein